MFAKPVPKKPVSSVAKQKVPSKPKTLSVKTGVKTSQNVKKAKVDSKAALKTKPPPRPEAGYSLYSTDSEDQVATAFDEMQACERILTHLKSKQKPGVKTKTKSKRKSGETVPQPKALNENPPVSSIVPGISSLYGTPFPYSSSIFLRQLQDYSSNPMFNCRLASSTPDPEKLHSDVSATGVPGTADFPAQDVPERDISTVSSVSPSSHHLQNMADMVEIYKRLEMNKIAQLQEAVAKEAIEKINAMEINKASADISQGQGNADLVVGQRSNDHSGVEILEQAPNRESEGFVATGSLGFPLQTVDSAFRPVAPSTGDFSSDIEHRQGSSLTAFQPYLSTDSNEALPPKSWLTNVPNLEGDSSLFQGHLIGQTGELAKVFEEGSDVPITGRTDRSDGTEYIKFARSEVRDQGDLPKSGVKVKDANVTYERQNGLFQIHRKTNEENTTLNSSENKSDKTDSTTKGQSSLDEVPERDVPKVEAGKSDGNSSNTQTVSSQEETPRLVGQKNDSQNLSGLTSTPRLQNASSATANTSSGGKIVFIPNDSATPNVIGYVPSIPLFSGGNQPMSWPVTNNMGATTAGPGSVISSVTGQQGASALHLTAQSGPQGAQDMSGSGYHSTATAHSIAASDIGVRKLRYLLKELKECSKVTKDSEVNRLVTELDDTVTSIPQLALTFNLQTEIDLAIQPLRSENSQLRRKLRLINQQLKEKSEDQEPKDINFELLHLQTSNETLQKVIKEEKEIKTRLAAEVQYLYQEIHKMKVDRSKHIAETSEKETEQLKVRQELALESQKLKHELDVAKKTEEAMLSKLESVEKENHILQITLQQRDDEIARQQEIVETMKESISELLHELEQSRAEDQAWDQNQSYGLHRLMKIVEEDNNPVCNGGKGRQPIKKTTEKTPDRPGRSPKLRGLDFDSSGATASTARLTKAALDVHNRRHGPAVPRFGPGGRQGPASESELDTLIEMQAQRKPVAKESNKLFQPGHRRTSSSSPITFKRDFAGNLRQYGASSSPKNRKGNVRDAGGHVRGTSRDRYVRLRERTEGKDSDEETELSPTRRQQYSANRSPGRRVARLEEYSPSRKRIPDSAYNFGTMGNSQPDGTEVSVEQSRYSVTDYFRKYHPQESSNQRREQLTEYSKPASSRMPLTSVNNRFTLQLRTSSEIDDRTAKSSDVNDARVAQRLAIFRGDDDQTISAIHDDIHDDDNVSSVTTATTVDDRKFRRGIATLDANIAKLQKALQRTKSMLT